MTTITRAERRHRRDRAVAYARRKLLQWGEAQAAKAPWWADNMAKCDCWMCNGEARWTKPAERRYKLQVETGE
jgi:hypothetical protein